MRAYRIVKHKHAATVWTGYGAQTYGGRWNSTGRRAVYCAGSIALAMLEMLVHLNAREVLESYRVFEIEVADAELLRLDTADLPDNWRTDPAPPETQCIGDAWLDAGASVGLLVPSVIVPDESNLIESNLVLNPAHSGFAAISSAAIERELWFDRRLKG